MTGGSKTEKAKRLKLKIIHAPQRTYKSRLKLVKRDKQCKLASEILFGFKTVKITE